MVIIDYELLDLIPKKELKQLLNDTRSAEKFRKALTRVENSDSNEIKKYGWIKLV